jgi:pimeloyl-ACP methyl ester carboxylesterase
MMRWRSGYPFHLLLFITLLAISGRSQVIKKEETVTANDPRFRNIRVDGVNIFYREAGPVNAPAILMLHGFPSSSRMFNPLLTLLSEKYRMIAPDYPGFGNSDHPKADEFRYTFDHIAGIVDHFAIAIGLSRYSLYVQDYGGPIGFRLALAHPERIESVIVQNAVIHEEGLGPLWTARRAFWANRSLHEEALRENLISLKATRQRHIGNDPDITRYDPDLWKDEFSFLCQPGEIQIQSDLFYDYQTNVASYPAYQRWLQQTQPPLLVLWGKYDPSFQVSEVDAYKRDVAGARTVILDAGHFALDTDAKPIAQEIDTFLTHAVSHPR